MILNDKYVAFRTGDRGHLDQSLEPGTYFMLKQGDILAVSTLRSYVNNALTMIELDRMGYIHLLEEQRRHLLELADYAAQLSSKWEQADSKLPD